ncbi:aminotransferase class I/II-fold pyridoxal phosphate-dependent enzyme [Alicyclobacillus sp. ALC3]|uniref:aminotransferase class I/II-fold pyridoxal phosphate-dependent enzyme n=1 Tax=Alicyclobacillus sp. ALC3 TaxID=2796143 RepID=UPI0023798190|nr:aminotransferase class I/II-fold pyridoxal phosphate-dependent enzyme [Alicyclobacillus sp. ALC3]WDL96787.1 aminotransferase class I/II-fold pyridoxal phosphate-dependent enzyme [Alicyclobacillus sp. ALC3]
MSNGPQYSTIIRSLEPSVPFVSPFTIERDMGRPFRLRLGANESSFGISPKAFKAMNEALETLYWYCDPEAYDLRQALAKRHGVTVKEILIGSGIDDLLGLTVRTFMDPGDVAVTSMGTYPTFAYHVKGYGGKIHFVPYTEDFRNDLGALVDAAKRTNAKLLYLANPDNPSGTHYSKPQVESFLNNVPDCCLVILDEAYIEFAPRDVGTPIQTHDRRVIRMRTFSKVYGLAGARIGYAITNSETVDAFDKVRLHYGVNSVALAGALASLNDPTFERTVIQEVQRGRHEYETLGNKLGLPVLPSYTNFVCFNLQDMAVAKRVALELKKRGVFVRQANGQPFDRFIRVTVGSPTERTIFSEILSEVATLLEVIHG